MKPASFEEFVYRSCQKCDESFFQYIENSFRELWTVKTPCCLYRVERFDEYGWFYFRDLKGQDRNGSLGFVLGYLEGAMEMKKLLKVAA